MEVLHVFGPNLLFFAHHDVKWRSYISTPFPFDIINQVRIRGTYFGPQHTLDRAINSYLAWHPMAAMLAIWANLKSCAHLATMPCT